MRKLLALLPLLFLLGVADARLPKGCACNGLPFVAEPTFAPPAGTYPSTQNVTVSTTTAGATLYCTVDGSQPTTSSPVCTNPEVISTTTTLMAIGVKTGFNQSITQIGLYTIETQAAAPVILPISGTYATVNATITDATPGAVIHYSIGSTATCASATYSTAVPITSSGTLYAIACAAGYTNSNVTSNTYTISGTIQACNPGVTVGTLNLTAKATRVAGASPLLVFFDATGTTDSGILNATSTPFLDVTYSWKFGDGGTSGTSTWNYGSNPGHNSRNIATGAMAAHLYIVPDNAGDTTYDVVLTATDGTNTAQCNIDPVIAYDPTDAPPQGFSGTNTVCVSSSGTPAGGAAGCPAGATGVNAATFGAALPTAMSGLRYLFKCGDTFGASPKTLHGNTFRIGAYGSCLGQATGRPIFQLTQSGYGITVGSGPVQSTDGVISDIDFEGTGTFTSGSTGYALFNGQDTPSHTYPMQIVLWNILSNNNDKTWQDYQGSQNGLIQVVMNNAGQNQGIFFNNSGNQCTNGAHSYTCGGTNAFDNINYNAAIGSHFNANGNFGLGSGPETVRVSACRLCVFTNSDYQNATSSTAVFKFHDDSNSTANGPWYGQYAELSVFTDNAYSGSSGAQLVEITPENAVTDERNRNLLIERNIFMPSNGSAKGLALSVCTNARVSDNVFVHGQSGLAIQKRGIECTSTSGAPVNTLSPELVESYNNTCYNSGTCELSTAWTPAGAAGNDNWFINTLAYNSGGGSVIAPGGTGNTISNNTSSITANPAFTNGSGLFDVISDFQPTANYSGALNGVPVFYDALGTPWSPAWNLGALSASTIVLQQPIVTGIAGNLFVEGSSTGLPPNGQFALVADQKNPDTGSGLFQVNTWDPSALTGFAAVNPSTAQLAYQATGINPTTMAQFEGNTAAAYLQAADQPSQTDLLISPQTFFAGLNLFTSPSVVLSESMSLQIHTATGTGPWLPVKHFFTGQNGNPNFDISVLLFRTHGSTTPAPLLDYDAHTNALVFVVPLGVTTSNPYLTSITGAYTTSTGSTFVPLAWSISQPQVIAVLNYINANNTGLPPGSGHVTFSTDPTQYRITTIHVNAEIQGLPSSDTFGWSMRGWVGSLSP